MDAATTDAAPAGAALRLLDLSLTNVGPFDHAEIEFATEADGMEPVTLLTGQNGTGKTIVLDAIRGVFGAAYGALERRIWREGQPLNVRMRILREGRVEAVMATRGFASSDGRYYLSVIGEHPFRLSELPNLLARQEHVQDQIKVPWVVDYWRSSASFERFDIQSLTSPDPRRFLSQSLGGTVQNQELTTLLCHFEWLRTSTDEKERREGEILYEAARRIVRAGLLDGGELVRIERKTLTPMVKQAGQEVPIGQLSSGNLYLVQRMIGLLGKMMAAHELSGSAPEEITRTPGVLLIDEAENHLHPRWQKRLIPSLRDIFPNVQIIAATHSPFVLASAPGARVYVCRYEPGAAACTIHEETKEYATRPVEDILLSEAFDGTQPFGEEITRLLAQRQHAIAAGDADSRRQIEEELLRRNPERFAYLDVESKLAALVGRAA